MSKKVLLGLGIAAVAAVTIGSFGATVLTAKPADTAKRASNGCTLDRRPVSTTVMLVDFTDAPTAANISQLERIFRDLRQSIPKDGKAIVALLDVAAESNLSMALQVCNPGAKNGDFAPRPGPSVQDQRWLQNYYRPFDEALKAAKTSPTSSDRSPIMEAITSLTQRADFDGVIANRKLIVVSDGLQLTPKVYSQFKGGDLWKSFEKSRLPAMTQADLTNVEVTFVYLLRPEYAQRQTEAHRAFLRRWFESRGARSLVFRGIREEGS
ncbi:hypothetical protein ACQQ2Q_22295 [Agrobacterium sp. ES01]|uniref:hypothetical protein n=1 Tax=Agrobacterium sp. ES01 TaxID=3420714 RepID=UPI003D0EE377